LTAFGAINKVAVLEGAAGSPP